MASIVEKDYTSCSVDSFYDGDFPGDSVSFETLEEAEEKFESIRKEGPDGRPQKEFELLLVKWRRGHVVDLCRRSRWEMNPREGRMEEVAYYAGA